MGDFVIIASMLLLWLSAFFLGYHTRCDKLRDDEALKRILHGPR